jgi:hypothetical protein
VVLGQGIGHDRPEVPTGARVRIGPDKGDIGIPPEEVLCSGVCACTAPPGQSRGFLLYPGTTGVIRVFGMARKVNREPPLGRWALGRRFLIVQEHR